MKSLSVITALLGISTLDWAAFAQGPTAVQPLPGYKCMRLKLTHEQVVDRSLQIPVFVGPSSASGKLGNASAIVIVKSPMHVENGYAEILFPDGRTAWLTRDLLIPYATPEYPNADCTPSLMSNGKPGFG
jgi:hypothetical protein